MKDSSKEQTLLMLVCRWSGSTVKVSTQQTVDVATWDKELQRCITSKEKFTDRTNRNSRKVNKILDSIIKALEDYFRLNDPDKAFGGMTAQEVVKHQIQLTIDRIIKGEKEEEDKKNASPLQFFSDYIDRNRIDPHTGRYVSERTKGHHKTVLHRLQRFFQDKHIADDFSTFDNPRFDAIYTDWCYKERKYKLNTVRATYGVLKPWLNAAKKEGYNVGERYKELKGKGEDVDNIYLTEDEIERIYHLDIAALKASGDIDMKSEIESSRDLFVIGCWTGLRRSDLNKLNEALFDIDKKLITLTAEKTKRRVVIPMHPFVLELWNKYQGHFPHLCDKAKVNQHLKECGRLAKVDEKTPFIENRAGQVKTLIYRKYELIGMHTARRSFATNMYKRRLPTIAIMQLTGHTTEHNFLKYIKVTKEENAQMIAESFSTMFNSFEGESNTSPS